MLLVRPEIQLYVYRTTHRKAKHGGGCCCWVVFFVISICFISFLLPNLLNVYQAWQSRNFNTFLSIQG